VKRTTAIIAVAGLLAGCATEPAGVERYVDVSGKGRGEAEFSAAAEKCRAVRTRVFQDEFARLSSGAGPGTPTGPRGASVPERAGQIADREMEKCLLGYGWQKR
jgi:hypothetical protein